MFTRLHQQIFLVDNLAQPSSVIYQSENSSRWHHLIRQSHICVMVVLLPSANGSVNKYIPYTAHLVPRRRLTQQSSEVEPK